MNNFGLIGDPIAKSLSPLLFNAAYAGKYGYDLIQGNDFGKSWKAFEDRYKGVNVTAPFKEQAFRNADYYTSYCHKIGAANLIVKTPEGILADNTDFLGNIYCIAEAYFPGLIAEFTEKYGEQAHVKIHQFFKQAIGQLFTRKPQALIVGCGGAGRAAAVAAAELGFDTALMNRTADKAQRIADEMPEYNFIVDQMTDFKAAFKECDLVIYTLPMKLDAIDSLEYEDFEGEDRYAFPRPAKVVLEANYKNPSFDGETMKRLRSAGCQYVSGLNWLLYQAISGYARFTGERPDYKAMSAALARHSAGMQDPCPENI